MGKLIYATISSFDGYTADAEGSFDWAAPDEEVHAFVNELERPIGTYLYGRRTYETMQVWETAQDADWAKDSPIALDYAAVWQAAEKVVYSTTLEAASTSRTRIEPTFDPEAVRALKAAAPTDLGIGGPTLAAEALRAGLVDEFHAFLSPVIIGSGLSSLPDGLRLDLELHDQRRFESGVVWVKYAVR